MRWTKKIGVIEGWALLSIEDLISSPRPRAMAGLLARGSPSGRRRSVVETWRTGSPLIVAASLLIPEGNHRRRGSPCEEGRASCPSTISRIGRSPGDASRRTEPRTVESGRLQPRIQAASSVIISRTSVLDARVSCMTAPAGRTRRPRFNQRAALIAATSTAL